MRNLNRSIIILIYFIFWVSGNISFSQEDAWSQRVDALLENSEDNNIVLTAVGDMIFNREITDYPEPAYQNLYRIIQGADIGFGNLEMSLNEKPELQKGAYNFRRGRDFGWEILKLGINLVGVANNHAFDYKAVSAPYKPPIDNIAIAKAPNPKPRDRVFGSLRYALRYKILPTKNKIPTPDPT